MATNQNTIQDVAERGVAYLRRFGFKGPVTRDQLYHHVGIQQQRMFTEANAVNPEYFGAQAIGVLSNGAVDLKLLAPPLAMCERVNRIVIENSGPAAYANGTRVRVVTSMETEVLTLPPRVMIHDGVIQQVGADLAGVISLRVFYSELPPHYDGLTADTQLVRLESPFDHTLSVAVALEVLRQTMDMPDAGRAAALPVIEKDYNDEIATFLRHVVGFSPVTSYRSRRQPPRP